MVARASISKIPMDICSRSSPNPMAAAAGTRDPRRAANTASGERRGSCVALIVGYGLPMNATSEQSHCPTVPTDQPVDPRWRRFAEGEWRCTSCGLLHTGLAELECEYPEFWSGSPDKGPNAGILTSDHILTEDFCIINGEHYFV